MAVRTTFNDEQLARYLVVFQLGDIVEWRPIEESTQNSNFHIAVDSHEDGTRHEYILTIAEDLGFDEVPFFTRLLTHLHHYGLPVAPPCRTLDGMTITIFCGKPTVMVEKLPGQAPALPAVAHCRAVGAALGELHDATAGSDLSRDDSRDLAWMETHIEELEGGDRDLLADTITQYRDSLSGAAGDLVRGIIHGNLRRDNTLFEGDTLTGIVGFYQACDGFYVEDLAITVNDWCRLPDGKLDAELCEALLMAYHAERPLSDAEKTAWPQFLRIAGAKAWLDDTGSADQPRLRTALDEPWPDGSPFPI